ncbi:hypothetical protein D3C72_1111070 [compost metagenome]
MAGQVQLDLAAGLAAIGVFEQAAHRTIGQHLAAVVAQADAGVVQFRLGGRTLHVHQRVVALAGGVLRCLAGGIAATMRTVTHAGAAAAFHALHRRHVVAAVAPAAHVMTHVAHRQQWARVARGNRCLQAMAHGEGTGGIAGAAHVLAEEGEGILAAGFNQYVVGFGRGDAELVDADRMDVLAIGGDHGHLQAGDAHVEVGHRRAVDEAQQHLLATAEQPGPVAGRRSPVHQVGVGVRVDVGDVAGRHPHPAPHAAVGQRGRPAIATGVAQEVGQGALVVVVVLGELLHAPEQRARVRVGPVGQHDHVLAVMPVRRRLCRVDDQRTVQPRLFLEQRMAVIPVGAGLLEIEMVVVGLAGADAVEAQAGHAIHVGRQQDAVPVDRSRVLAERVAHEQVHGLAFAPAQDRCRQRAVDGDRRAGAAGEVGQ